jgi:phosphatidylglycerol:prolipoprotein diacylglycerol transferase
MPLWQLQAPTATALQLGAFSIRWYGICLALGIGVAYWIVARLRHSRGQSMQTIEQLIFIVIIAGIIGGRLLHVILEWWYYHDHLLQIPQVWLGGLAIHGAIIAGVLALYLTARHQREVFAPLLDQFVIGLALAQAIGRWGNYFNQELYGQPTSSWFGIYIEPQLRITNYEMYSTFQPIFLYESLGLILLTGILLRFYRRNISGLTTAGYLIGYGLIRFVIGYLRIDAQLSFGQMRFDQWESLGFIIVGLVVIWRIRMRRIQTSV